MAGPKILLVEDSELNSRMLRRRLEQRGYEVLLAEDGLQALEAARTQVPDVILMDLAMPVMDGWQATRELKAAQDTRRIPVIALTAYAMKGDREAALACGADDYETKPIEFSRLLDKIAAQIARSRQ